MWGTWVQSLDREDPLEKAMAPHCSPLAWRTPWTEEPGGLHTAHGVAKGRRLRDLTQNLIDWEPVVFTGGWSCRHLLLVMYANSRLPDTKQGFKTARVARRVLASVNQLHPLGGWRLAVHTAARCSWSPRQARREQGNGRPEGPQGPRARFSSPHWRSSQSSRRAVFSPRCGPRGSATQPPRRQVAPGAFSGGAHRRFRNTGSRWPQEILVTGSRLCSKTQLLHSRDLQSLGWEPEDLAGEPSTPPCSFAPCFQVGALLKSTFP